MSEQEYRDYLAIESKKEQAKKARAAAVKLGVQEDPEAYAKALSLSFKTGIPVQGVKDGLPEIEQTVKGVELASLLKESPSLERWMGAHPDNAALSHDDAEILSRIASSSERAKKAEQLRVDAENRRKGLAGFSGSMKGLGAKLVSAVNNDLFALPGELTKTVSDATIGRAFGPGASQKFSTYANPIGSWIAGVARKNVDYLSGSVRETPSMFIKDPVTGEEFFNEGSINPANLSTYESALNILAGEVPSMAAMIGLEAVTGGGATPIVAAKYGKLLKPLVKVGKYATRPAALMEVGRTIHGQRQQGVQELMEKKGISREQAEIEVAPGAILAGWLSFAPAAYQSKILEDLLQKIAKAPNGRTFATKSLAQLKSAAMQGSKEGIEEIVNGIGEDTAAWLTYNPDKTFREAAQNAAQNAFGGVILGGFTGGVMHGQLQGMADASETSKLRQRSPEKFREFIHDQVKDSPVEQVQVPVSAFQTYFQSQGIDPQDAAQSMGITNYSEALQAGTELVVPTAGLMTFAEHFAGLEPDVRIGGRLTPREQEAYQAEASKVEAEIAKQGTESVKDAEDPTFQRIYDDTRQQLIELGYTDRVADTEATKHASVMTNLANRAQAQGLDPEMVLRWQPIITRAKPGDTLADRVLETHEARAIFERGIEDRLFTDQSADGGSPSKVAPGDAPSEPSTSSTNAREVDPFTLFQNDRKFLAREAMGRALSPSGQSAELTRRANEAMREEDSFRAFEEEVKSVQAGDVYADKGERRAYITFGAMGGERHRVQIGLLEKANLSSLTHEFTHLYAEILRDVAEAGGIQSKEDLSILREFVGAEDDAPLTMEQHEKIARAGEQYLWEGKAPSEKLKPIFQRLKFWMMGVYRSLTGLGVKLNDDVRGVFDRLYASDAEIEQARNAVNDRPLFATAEDMKATQAEFESYAKAKAKEIRRAKDAHASKVLAELTREKEDWWKEESSKVREEVAAEVDADRLYKSFSALRDGQMEDGTPIKLNKEALEAQFGKGVGKELPRGFQRIYSREGGMDADSAAELLGWRSGEALIESLKNLEPRDERIKRLTEQRMKERHGDIMAPEALAESAQEAIHEEDPESKLIELRILRREQVKQRPIRELKEKLGQAKKATKTAKAEGEAALKEAELQAKSEEFWRRGVVAEVPPMATFKRAAADLVDAMQGKDYQPFRYLEAERRMNREAQEALAKNDYAAAADATQKSILNHFLFREATKAKAAMEADYEYVRKFGKKSVRERIAQAGGEQGQRVFLDQIDNILGMYQFTRETKKSIEARQSLAQFALDQANAGEMVSFDPMLFSQPKNYRELTRPELQAVMDGLKNLEAMARRDLGFIKDGKTVALKEAVQEMTDSAYGNLKSKPLPVDKNARSTARKISDRVKRLDAEFLKMEELVDRLDGGDINGPFRRYVFEPMCEAQYKEYELTQKITSKLSEAMEAMPKEQRLSMENRFEIEGIGTVTRKFILTMAMNTGNESNQTKMLKGMGWADPAGMDAVGKALGKLNRADWEFVQKTWDALDSLWPEIEKLELRMSGVAPKRVEVRPFTVTLADGSKVEMRGGYFPVVYDPSKSTAGAKQGDVEIMKQDGGWNAPVTAKGHTKERNEAAAYPLLMDFEQILSKHVARVVKDLSHREAATAVAKLLQNQDVRTAIQTTLGPEYEAQFMPWLKSTVNDTAAMNPELGKFLLATRSNMVVGSLSFRAISVIVQVTDFGRVLIGHHRVGPAHLASALAVMARNPIDTVRQIRELSPEMTTRAENLDRDARATLKRLLGKDSVYAKAQRFGMQGLAIADFITSHTAWLGAYKQALAEGSTQAEAVKMADRVVRTKLMTGAPKDMTPIQRKGSGMQMLTTYMGDATAIYNMMSGSAFDIAQGKNRMNAVFTMVMAGMIIPLLGDLIKGKWPKDDDDEKAAWLAKQAAWNLPSSIPLVRDVASAMESGRDYQFTPLASALNKGAKFASKDIPKAMEGDVEWDNFFMHGLDAAGTLSGLPGTGQAMTTLRYARDLESGKEDPETKAGAAWGLVMGARKSK